MLDRPRIIYPSSVFFVHRIFNRLASANEGRLPDISLLNIHLIKALEDDPSLINLPFIARKLRKDWEKANHRVISAQTGEVTFVPGAAITVAPRLRVRMDSLDADDLTLWDATEQRARTNYNRTMDGRVAYRDRRLADFAVHPELSTLGAVERTLHGYAPDKTDDTPFAEGEDAIVEEEPDDADDDDVLDEADDATRPR